MLCLLIAFGLLIVMWLQRHNVICIIISYTSKATNPDVPEPSVSEVLIPVPEGLHLDDEVHIASCSPPRVHCLTFGEETEADDDEDEDNLINNEERQLISHLQFQGVPR